MYSVDSCLIAHRKFEFSNSSEILHLCMLAVLRSSMGNTPAQSLGVYLCVPLWASGSSGVVLKQRNNILFCTGIFSVYVL